MERVHSSVTPYIGTSPRAKASLEDMAAQTTIPRWAVWLFIVAVGVVSGHRHHHNQQGSIEKLLAAGLIAKALAKGGEEGGGGGGGGGGGHHHFMPMHMPIHGRDAGGGGGHHHHHVHHKYVPIPVKHHTNFIIAHHKVPVPIVKTKVVHVPVQQTRIVPIIVQPPHRSRPGGEHFPLPSEDRKVRVTSLGTIRSNGTAPMQFHRSPGSPDKWIVVVKSKRRRQHARKS